MLGMGNYFLAEGRLLLVMLYILAVVAVGFLLIFLVGFRLNFKQLKKRDGSYS